MLASYWQEQIVWPVIGSVIMGRPLSQQFGEMALAVKGYVLEGLSKELQAAVEVVVLPKAEVWETASGVRVPAELSLLLLVTLLSAPAAGEGLMEDEVEVRVVAAKGDWTFGWPLASKWLEVKNCKCKEKKYEYFSTWSLFCVKT